MLADAVNACVAIAYRVDKYGLTSPAVVLKAWDSVNGRKASAELHEDEFARAAAVAVASWRFQPVAGAEPTPSMTVSTFGFMADDVASKAAVRSHCRTSNDELAAIGGDSSLGKGRSSRADRIPAAFWPPNTMPGQRIHADNVSRRLQPAVVQTSR
ncbi:MAG: hypothetical protein KDI75_08125 [Xanthomonadales bacterium]|nr:hypothetical protein [Xanthomonadales bacterium]